MPHTVAVQSNVDQNNLKLTGDKINLTTRPLKSNNTASSRHALLGKSCQRPLSAIPLLKLYSLDEFDHREDSRRPLSADNSVAIKKFHLVQNERTNSLESIKETENDLPSSQLLKNLLLEPLSSWRNGIKYSPNKKVDDFTSCSHTTTEESASEKSNDEYSAASLQSITMDHEIKQLPQRDAVVHLEEIGQSSLKPGLKTKPPLPKKPDHLSALRQNNSPFKNNIIEEEPQKITNRDCDASKVLFTENNCSDQNRKNYSLGYHNQNDDEFQSETSSHGHTTSSDLQFNTMEFLEDAKCSANFKNWIELPENDTKSCLSRKTTNKVDDNFAITSPIQDHKVNISREATKTNYSFISTSLSTINDEEVSLENEKSAQDYKKLQKKDNYVQDYKENTKFQNWMQEQREGTTEEDFRTQRDVLVKELKFQQNELKGLPDLYAQATLKKLEEYYESQTTSELNQADENETSTKKSFGNLGLIQSHANYSQFFETSTEIFEDDLAKSKKPEANKSHAKAGLVDKEKPIPTKTEGNGPHKANTINKINNTKTTSSNSKIKVPSLTNISTKHEKDDGKQKTKFVATPMRNFADYSETSANNGEIESWMSSDKSNAKKNDPAIDKQHPNAKNHKENFNENKKQSNYFDFLSHLDELDLESVEQCPKNNCNDKQNEEMIPPERETHVDISISEETQSDDEIISILKVLEAQDKKSHKQMESMQEIVTNELTHKISPQLSKMENSKMEPDIFKPINEDISSSSDGEIVNDFPSRRNNSRNKENYLKYRKKEAINSSPNLTEILSYLDEVDKNCSKSLTCAKERVKFTAQVLENNIRLDTIPKVEELLLNTPTELAHHIIDLSLRLKDKSSSITLLQNELSSLRQYITKVTKQTDQTIRQKLKTQKEEYEAVIKRHQKFIDQLIADKKTLNQQCEGLIHEMKVLEDRYHSNLQTAENRHKIELHKVKEMHIAGEKIRRERWIDSKTQKIKELTVKGLEPELDKMAARHQQEITDLRSFHKRELEDLELKAARKTQQQCEALREQLVAEREKALTHERDVMRQRYEQLVESEEKGYQEQRRRLIAEHANRMAECAERDTAAVAERDRAIKQTQNEFEDKLQTVVRRHNNEIQMLKDRTELEMEAFRNNYKKQNAMQLAEKEATIKERCKKERDKEIEAVIERLEMESNETKLQIEHRTENRIRRMKEKYENEIKDLETSETDAKNKYSVAKSKLLEAEDIILNLKTTIKHIEIELNEVKERANKLSMEKSKLKEVVRQEMKHEVEQLEREIRSLKNDKDKELQQVYARLKVAVARKDEVLSELSRDHLALQEKCTYLENMLEQQRKDYLIK